MSNLERLSLCLLIHYFKKKRFIDGNDLKKNIVNHLPQLNKFIFNIRSKISLLNQIHLPSNEEIQHTFTNFNDRIISCVDYFPKRKIDQCHIYSCPHTMTYYHNITNNFTGGLFKYVHDISLIDEHPFEHEFFIRIAQAFPFLKTLSLRNKEPQQHKQSQRLSNENNQNYSIIKYPQLISLDLLGVHEDYVEQFLDSTKTCLSKNITLYVDYKPLENVTHYFTRETTRVNCAKLKDLHIYNTFKMTDQFRVYFPLINRRSMFLMLSYY